jgi:hypothetical protein
VRTVLAFRAIRNKIQTNGGEIFQEESGRGAILRTGNGISQAFGKLDAFDARESSCGAGDNGRYWRRELRLAAPYHTEIARRCDLDAEPDLRRIGRGGEFSQEKSPLRFLSSQVARAEACRLAYNPGDFILTE